MNTANSSNTSAFNQGRPSLRSLLRLKGFSGILLVGFTCAASPLLAQDGAIRSIEKYELFDPHEDPSDLFLPGANDWVNALHLLVPVPTNYLAWDLCGLNETNYVGAGPCFQPVIEAADGTLAQVMTSYIAEDGRAWVNPTALTTLYLAGAIQSYPTDYFRTYAGFAQDEAWPSNMELSSRRKMENVEVTPEQWADVCDFVGGGFMPVAVTLAFNTSNDVVSMYGPVCFARMKPTPEIQKLGIQIGATDSDLVAIGGVLEDGTAYMDYSLLAHNGLLTKEILVNEIPIPLWSYLACRSPFPFTAENGESYMIEDTRKACQPGSPASSDNMDAPPPYVWFMRS